MRYVLIVGHAGFAEGMESALQMLMGPREFVVACGMGEGTEPAEYAEALRARVASLADLDEAVVMGDIAGGFPVRCAREALWGAGLSQATTLSFGGANLPMAIAAVMCADDGLALDATRDALLAEGTQGVREL